MPGGAALLAAYKAWRKEEEGLEEYLERRVFSGDSESAKTSREEPEETDQAGYDRYMEDYRRMLKVERTAVEEMAKEQ